MHRILTKILVIGIYIMSEIKHLIYLKNALLINHFFQGKSDKLIQVLRNYSKNLFNKREEYYLCIPLFLLFVYLLIYDEVEYLVQI